MNNLPYSLALAIQQITSKFSDLKYQEFVDMLWVVLLFCSSCLGPLMEKHSAGRLIRTWAQLTQPGLWPSFFFFFLILKALELGLITWHGAPRKRKEKLYGLLGIALQCHFLYIPLVKASYTVSPKIGKMDSTL